MQLEIDDMECNIDAIQRAIDEKEAPMKVAQYRLDTRIWRPNVELCVDSVEKKLREEVTAILHRKIYLSFFKRKKILFADNLMIIFCKIISLIIFRLARYLIT